MSWNQKLFMILMSTALATASCDSKKDSDDESPLVKTNSDSDGQADSGDELVEASVEILSLTYSAADHKIVAEISYGGCAQTQHQLILNDICTESYPMGCSARIVRAKDFDASCKMLMKDLIELKLSDKFDTSNVSVKSLKTFKSVLVDRQNKLGNQAP